MIRKFLEIIFFYLGIYYKRNYSLSGEDIVLKRLLEKLNIKKGFYVDVGAFNPSRFSNTKLLYKRGWSGMNIEPFSIFPFKIWRRRDINIKCAISDMNCFKYLNIAKDKAHNSFIKEFGEGNIRVPTVTLKQLLEEYDIKNIDVLDIDVEFHDYEVLMSHNWNIKPLFILIEIANDDVEETFKNPIYIFLKDKGYKLRSVCMDTLIWELIKK